MDFRKVTLWLSMNGLDHNAQLLLSAIMLDAICEDKRAVSGDLTTFLYGDGEILGGSIAKVLGDVIIKLHKGRITVVEAPADAEGH